MRLVDGIPTDSILADDRGLNYGDGLFETIRFIHGYAPLWKRHMQRLVEGCARLYLPVPDLDILLDEATRVCAGCSDAVVRVTLTRGVGERGYRPPLHPDCIRIVTAFQTPLVPTSVYVAGVSMHRCQMRLAEQPLLAGIKHLCRLEQVLARTEWSDPAVAEGLLCDHSGRVISATCANLFAVIGGTLATPTLVRCGIAGVARAEVLGALPQCQVRDITLESCLEASELFLTSSVRGILPVRSVADKVYAPGSYARSMQAHWQDLGFPMEHIKV